MDRADARAGQHRDRRFGNIRQVNNDAIALPDLVSFQNIREPANVAMQLLISERAFLARLAFPNNGRLVAAMCGQMSIQTIFREIEFAADEPFRERRFPFEHFPPAFLP